MNLENIKPKIRYAAEMDSVIYDRKWIENSSDLKLYYMYRDLAENEEDHKKAIEENLRYDITVLPPLMLGKEYLKTAGHGHPIVPQTKLTYPEIYEVLRGKAIFLLQSAQGGEINNVYAISAKENDKIIIPPNYDHLMINTSNQELKTANWVCREFAVNIYDVIQEKRGFCYYALKGNLEEEINWVKNENYTGIPSLEFLSPNLNLEKFGITKEEKLYDLIKTPEKLNFLKTPQNYDWK